MKHIVLYSGGANSAYVAYLVAQKETDVVLLHNPTYSEHPDADRFRKQFAEYLGLPITVQADGRDIWQLMLDEHCLPSDRIPFCSRELKSKPADEYYKTLDDDITVYYGYGGKEWRRAQRSTARLLAAGIEVRFPIIDACISDKDVKTFITSKIGICLPEPYLYLQHNNCIPCFKGGKFHFYQVWKYYPEYFAKAVAAEKQIGYTVFKGEPLTKLAIQWAAQPPLLDDEDLRPCMCAF